MQILLSEDDVPISISRVIYKILPEAEGVDITHFSPVVPLKVFKPLYFKKVKTDNTVMV